MGGCLWGWLFDVFCFFGLLWQSLCGLCLGRLRLLVFLFREMPDFIFVVTPFVADLVLAGAEEVVEVGLRVAAHGDVVADHRFVADQLQERHENGAPPNDLVGDGQLVVWVAAYEEAEGGVIAPVLIRPHDFGPVLEQPAGYAHVSQNAQLLVLHENVGAPCQPAQNGEDQVQDVELQVLIILRLVIPYFNSSLPSQVRQGFRGQVAQVVQPLHDKGVYVGDVVILHVEIACRRITDGGEEAVIVPGLFPGDQVEDGDVAPEVVVDLVARFDHGSVLRVLVHVVRLHPRLLMVRGLLEDLRVFADIVHEPEAHKVLVRDGHVEAPLLPGRVVGFVGRLEDIDGMGGLAVVRLDVYGFCPPLPQFVDRLRKANQLAFRDVRQYNGV